MAKRHFDEFFNEFYSQYIFVLDRTRKLLKEYKDNPTEELSLVIENFKIATTPIVNNYFIYKKVKELLDKPNRKSKKEDYERMLRKNPDEEEFSPRELRKQNAECMKEIKELTDCICLKGS